MTLDNGRIAVPGGRPDVVLARPRMSFVSKAEAIARPLIQLTAGTMVNEPEEEGQEDAAEAVGEERLQAAAAPEHGGEEAAQQEEHGHAEAVDGGEEQPVGLALPGILHRPGGRA